MNYDVVVCGAGPAGLTCALELSKKGLKVCVLEKSAVAGEPNFSTGGIPFFTKQDFNIPDSVVVDSFNKISFLSNSKIALFRGDFVGGYVLDFRKYKIYLTEQFKKLGGVFISGARIFEVKEFVNGYTIYYKIGSSPIEITSRYLVDATGKDTFISDKLGLSKHVKGKPTVGEEYIIKANPKDFYKNNLTIHIGKKYFQNGYAWVFPYGENTYKVGVIKYDVDSHRDKNSIDSELQNFVTRVVGNEYEILEKHGGTLFLTNKIIKSAKGNFIMIGDSINMCNPLFAEGIRHALEIAKISASVIYESFKSETNLENFNFEVINYKKNKWLLSRIFATFLYHFPFDWARNFLAKLVVKLTYADLIDIAFRYKYNKLLKLLI